VEATIEELVKMKWEHFHVLRFVDVLYFANAIWS